MADYVKISERRKAMAAEEGEDVQLIFCKRRKFLRSEHGNMYSGDVKSPENSLSSASSVAYACSEDDEPCDDVQKESRSPDLENVDSEEYSGPEVFETEISAPINGGSSNLCTPSSELYGDSEEVSMGSSTSRKKQSSSQAVKSRRDLASTVAEKMPSTEDIEEFFAAAEKFNQKQFTEKYNYDFVKDVPLEGRYQWVQLQP